jgi:hypothetical protein
MSPVGHWHCGWDEWCMGGDLICNVRSGAILLCSAAVPHANDT